MYVFSSVVRIMVEEACNWWALPKVKEDEGVVVGKVIIIIIIISAVAQLLFDAFRYIKLLQIRSSKER